MIEVRLVFLLSSTRGYQNLPTESPVQNYSFVVLLLLCQSYVQFAPASLLFVCMCVYCASIKHRNQEVSGAV